MTDTINSERRSWNMSRIRSRDTKPEMSVRRLLHGLGYRYRLHRSDLPGKPDLTFGPKRKVIFVHGCFWHQHPDPECKIARVPKSRPDYWQQKLSRNMTRDLTTMAALSAMDWKALVVWECQTTDLEKLRHTVQDFLSDEADESFIR
jgi:DNA mismatch endonuclease (patch repair protein)